MSFSTDELEASINAAVAPDHFVADSCPRTESLSHRSCLSRSDAIRRVH